MLVTLGSRDDWPIWRELRLAAFADAPGAFVGAPEEWDHGGEQDWLERLTDPAALAVVAIEGGVGVGLARGALDDGAAWLHSLWVVPERRGTGLADELVAHVEAWARQRAPQLRLEVVPENARAIALYRRLGYQPSRLVGEPLPDGGNELVFEKVLVPWQPATGGKPSPGGQGCARVALCHGSSTQLP